MNKEVKKKWVKALRSGKYRRGTGDLKMDGNKCTKYCCLGVLTDLYIKEVHGSWEDYGDIAYLPKDVRDWAGLDYENPPCTDDCGFKTNLVSINDSNSASFNQIADLIDENL